MLKLCRLIVNNGVCLLYWTFNFTKVDFIHILFTALLSKASMVVGMLWSLSTYVLNDLASESEGSTVQINGKRIPNGIALLLSHFLINTTPSYRHHRNLCYPKRQSSHNSYVLTTQNRNYKIHT